MLTLKDLITVVGESDQNIVATVNETELAKALLVSFDLPFTTKYVRLSNRGHVALVDGEGCAFYPHQHWLTKKFVEAFEELDPKSEIVATAKAIVKAREDKYIDKQVSLEEERDFK